MRVKYPWVFVALMKCQLQKSSEIKVEDTNKLYSGEVAHLKKFRFL
jgi:hypothetical protein